MMVSLRFILCFSLVFIGYCASQDQIFMQDTQFQNLLPRGFSASWVQTPVYSAGACALACKKQNGGCQDFFYNKDTNTCQMTSSRFLINGGEEAAPGWRHYRTKLDSCPVDSLLHDESAACFKMYSSPTCVWTDARDYCSSLGGRLAVLDTASKTDFIVDLFQSGTATSTVSLWIGGHLPYTAWGAFDNTVSDFVWLNWVAMDWTYMINKNYAPSTEPDDLSNQAATCLDIWPGGTPWRIFNSVATHTRGCLCEFALY